MNDHSELIDQYCEACGSWWKLKKPAYFSLMFLCFRVAEFCRANRKQIAAPLRANIDEGLAKAGAIAQLPAFGDTFLNKELHFVRSVDHSRMQLADFAAFCISRSQWLMAKPDSRNPLAKGDRLFLEMASRLDVVNLNNITLNLKDHARADYDFMLSLDRIGKGLAPHPEE